MRSDTSEKHFDRRYQGVNEGMQAGRGVISPFFGGDRSRPHTPNAQGDRLIAHFFDPPSDKGKAGSSGNGAESNFERFFWRPRNSLARKASKARNNSSLDISGMAISRCLNTCRQLTPSTIMERMACSCIATLALAKSR